MDFFLNISLEEIKALEPRIVHYRPELESLLEELPNPESRRKKSATKIIDDFRNARKGSIILDFKNFMDSRIFFEVTYDLSLTNIFLLCLELCEPSEKIEITRTVNSIFKSLLEDSLFNFTYEILKFKPSNDPFKRLLCPSEFSFAHKMKKPPVEKLHSDIKKNQ